MKPCILVATPFRSTSPKAFRKISKDIWRRLTYSPRERVFLENEYHGPCGKYVPNAWARNLLVNCYLENRHTHVLWMDADLVDVPSDLIEALLTVSEVDIVAPFVLLEDRPDLGPCWVNRFYDIGGFIQLGGTPVGMWPPWFNGNGNKIIEMESVGTCYLVPADIYREGHRYDPVGDEVEHLSFMKKARAAGKRVLAVADIVVRHAYLPDYGEAWHG